MPQSKLKKRKAKGPTPLLSQLLPKIAPRIGATVKLEPEWGIVGQITFKSGRRRYFQYSTLDLNPMGASEIARDKDFASFFMADMGYPVVPGEKFYSKRWCQAIGSDRDIDAAYRYAQKIGLPVFVKPNSRSQGVAVTQVHTKREFYRAMRLVFQHDRVGLVQQPVLGRDYRLVVLDKRIISAYERIPLNIIGNGRSTIKQLLRRKQQQFVASSRDTRLDLTDPRIERKLTRQGLNLRSVPADGETIYVLDNANLSTGGDSVDVTDLVHPGFRRLAIDLTHDMGLRLCGVDLMIDGDISHKPGIYWVLEINSAPGLDHYVKTGPKQERIVEDLYLEVLKSMEKAK